MDKKAIKRADDPKAERRQGKLSTKAGDSASKRVRKEMQGRMGPKAG